MTPIRDPHELQQLIDLAAKNGIHLPANIKSVEELIRCLLIAHKTKAAVQAIQRKRDDRKRLAEQRQRYGNPDSPDYDEKQAMRRVASQVGAAQFSTANDVPSVARQIVDAQEQYMGDPNRFKNPFGP